MVSRKDLQCKHSRWGLHSIITMDGKPYCVFQKWELWQYKTNKTTGGRSIATMPSGSIKMEPLQEVLDDDNVTDIAEDLL